MHLLLEALFDPVDSLTEESLALERVENPERTELVQLTMLWEQFEIAGDASGFGVPVFGWFRGLPVIHIVYSAVVLLR
jgi:hypothetical protein